jgi:hypothetical protein
VKGDRDARDNDSMSGLSTSGQWRPFEFRLRASWKRHAVGAWRSDFKRVAANVLQQQALSCVRRRVQTASPRAEKPAVATPCGPEAQSLPPGTGCAPDICVGSLYETVQDRYPCAHADARGLRIELDIPDTSFGRGDLGWKGNHVNVTGGEWFAPGFAPFNGPPGDLFPFRIS